MSDLSRHDQNGSDSGSTRVLDDRASSTKDVERGLSRAADAIPYVAVAIGTLLAFGKLADPLSERATTSVFSLSARCVATATLLACAVVGWMSSVILRAVAAWLGLHSAQAGAAREIERRLGSVLGRLAEMPERAVQDAPLVPPNRPPRDEIGQERAANPGTIDQAFQPTRTDEAPASGGADREVDGSGSVETLRARIDAARAVNDPDRVLELREALAPRLETEARRELDRELARWSMNVILKRLRAGVMSPDVAVLATRAAECFDHTPEGASLRAALPTLRRSAGLCARCGQPYKGIADACPACLAPGPSPANPTAPIGESSVGDVSPDTDDGREGDEIDENGPYDGLLED